jgi:hypothetical protein
MRINFLFSDKTLHYYIIVVFIYFNCKWVLPGGSGTTIRHNTQTTHVTQNNTPRSNKTTQK